MIFQPSSAITPAWRWPGWSPGPPPVTRPSGSRGKGVRAYGVPQRLPGRQRGLVEPHPQGPAGPAGGSRQSAGRGAHHRQALQAHHPRRRNERFHPRPAALAGQAAPGRHRRRAPGHRPGTFDRIHTTPSVPTRACPGALPPPRHGTPPRWPRPPDRRTTTRPPNRPDHPGPRAHAAGTQIRPHRDQAHHHRTQRHHQPRRDRLPRLQLPSGPGGPDHLGRPQDHHHRPPRRGPHPVPVAATGNQVRLPPRPRHTRHPRRTPPQDPPKRHRCPDTPTVTDVLTQNCHRSPETSHPSY